MDADIYCGSWANGRPAGYDASQGTSLVDGAYRTNGCVFRQLPQDLPWLSGLYSQFELEFSTLYAVDWAAANWAVPIALCVVYLVLSLWVGPWLMAGRGKVECKNQLAVWNLLLAVFSAVGFVRTAPHLLYYAWRHGGWASVCAPAETAFGQGAVGLWVMLFIFSKVPELVDTVFLVITKKEVIFLHWYHHFTVLLYCWHSYATRSSAGLYFVSMNYGVHALMYTYFFLTSLGYRPKWNLIVTVLQISQMVVGVAVCIAVATRKYSQSKPCDVTDENFLAALVMYGSYLVLFVYFAVEKYLFPQAKAKKGGAAGAGSSSKAARALPEAAPAQAEEETLEVPVKRRATSTKPRKGAKGQ